MPTMNHQRQGVIFDCSQGQLLQPLQPQTTPSTAPGNGEEDPLQNPRPPEFEHNAATCREPKLVTRAKRWSNRVSARASVLWGAGGWSQEPPPVPRHRTQHKYNPASDDSNHTRLGRAYTCREMLCVVFLPCLLVCLLGISLCSLVIYYHLEQEYDTEIEELQQELAASREKNGVYLASNKYQAMVDTLDKQRIEVEKEKEVVAELGSVIKVKEHQLSSATSTMAKMKQTLDCSYTVLQQQDSPHLPTLDAKCKLSKNARLLLAVSDQAATEATTAAPARRSTTAASARPNKHATAAGVRPNKHRHNHGSQKHPEGQHWLLDSLKRGATQETVEFQRFLATHFNAMEQNIGDFGIGNDKFCSDLRDSLEQELERRSRELGRLSLSLSKIVEDQTQAVTKLENLASDQMYSEQTWMTSYLKSTRNSADRQSSSMQGFLADSFLPLVQAVNAGLRDQASRLASLQQTVNNRLATHAADIHQFLDRHKIMVAGARDNVLKFAEVQKKELVAAEAQQEKLASSEDNFGKRLSGAMQKIEGLLASLASDYTAHANLVNASVGDTSRGLVAAAARADEVVSVVSLAAKRQEDDNKALRTSWDQAGQRMKDEVADGVEGGADENKAAVGKMAQLGEQTRAFVGAAQAAWDHHYSEAETQLRKKADTSKQLLQNYQFKTQAIHGSLRSASNVLEGVVEEQRQEVARFTSERQADLQGQCKAVGVFTEMMTSELHARDSDIANYFFQDNNKKSNGR